MFNDVSIYVQFKSHITKVMLIEVPGILVKDIKQRKF
jgi:hypothetical protein